LKSFQPLNNMGLIMDWLILDWLILVLVTPLIIVVVVLLYGFVGCGFDAEGSLVDTKPLAPSNLTATAIGTDTIELVWQDNSGGQPRRSRPNATG
jgi:hypothetical protein